MIKKIILLLMILPITYSYAADFECKEGDCKNGPGKAIYRDGRIYKGEFKNGIREGNGEIVWPDGSKYEGEWKNNTYNGKGVFISNDRSRYEGEFKNGKMNGQGTCYYKNGDKYEGSFFNDLMMGEGTYTWPGGRKYVGRYFNDNRHGEGVMYNSDGSVLFGGEWVGDQPQIKYIPGSMEYSIVYPDEPETGLYKNVGKHFWKKLTIGIGFIAGFGFSDSVNIDGLIFPFSIEKSIWHFSVGYNFNLFVIHKSSQMFGHEVFLFYNFLITRDKDINKHYMLLSLGFSYETKERYNFLSKELIHINTIGLPFKFTINVINGFSVPAILIMPSINLADNGTYMGFNVKFGFLFNYDFGNLIFK